jgi:hypothetical protein
MTRAACFAGLSVTLVMPGEDPGLTQNSAITRAVASARERGRVFGDPAASPVLQNALVMKPQ